MHSYFAIMPGMPWIAYVSQFPNGCSVGDLYHIERNHQGVGNRLISPEAGDFGSVGMVERRQRLGGMLNYYYRTAALLR